MHNLRRFYYNNKTKIWIIILFIVFLLIILQVLNYLVSRNNEDTTTSILNSSTIQNTTKKENTNTSVTTDKSVVTGERLDAEKIQIASNLIEQFITFCNEQQVEEAYDLLSDECKEENFVSVESFKTLYYDSNFRGDAKKTATIENWFSNTYQVYITDDILSTGKISDVKKRDYITVVSQDGEYKLNIHNFIDKVIIDKEQTINNITFKIISKNVYMDYEEYTVQVMNKNDGTILLDTQQSTKTIYLEDTNSVKYYCYTNELISEFLKVNQGASTQLDIRFMRTFSSSSKDVSLNFSDIVLNYKGSLQGNLEKEHISIPI